MDNSERCRDQSAECLRLMTLAQSDIEARMLRDLAQSWIRIANQTERYIRFVHRAGQSRTSEHSKTDRPAIFQAVSQNPL